jgi:hypothetical protein
VLMFCRLAMTVCRSGEPGLVRPSACKVMWHRTGSSTSVRLARSVSVISLMVLLLSAAGRPPEPSRLAKSRTPRIFLHPLRFRRGPATKRRSRRDCRQNPPSVETCARKAAGRAEPLRRGDKG